MDDHLVLEDVPVLPEIAMPIILVDPEFPEVSEFSVMDMLDQDIVVPSMPYAGADFVVFENTPIVEDHQTIPNETVEEYGDY